MIPETIAIDIETGIPTESRLKELGLDYITEDLKLGKIK